MTTLGCGPVTFAILERGGNSMANLGSPFSDANVIEWSRRLDRVSHAAVYVNGTYGCCGWWDEVVPYKHELALFRDGQRFWRGPVTSVRFVRDEYRQVAINAADLAHWFDVRVLRSDKTYPVGTDLGTVAADMINDAINRDPSPNISFTVSPTGVTVDEPDGRKYLRTQYRTYGSILDELSRSGFDWTAVDSTIIGGGSETPTGLPELFLFDEHFAAIPDIGREGGLFAVRFFVTGNGRGENGTVNSGASPLDLSMVAEYGLVERVISEWDIRDKATAGNAAISHYEIFGKNGPPRVIEGAKLSENAPVTVAELIPGRRVRISVDPCPDILDVWRLSSVEGYHGPEADTVSISLEPIGTTDFR